MTSSAEFFIGKAAIVYDGDCVFCHSYVRLIRLRESVGSIELIDARSDDPRVERLQKLGYNLNDGMLFIWNGQSTMAAMPCICSAAFRQSAAGSTSSTEQSSPTEPHRNCCIRF
ncbi:MAG: DUF393 domain-containing protein [Pseudolabrys sp.]|nr:DUF393 domain-containing protein [Pseudolabrys sp.]